MNSLTSIQTFTGIFFDPFNPRVEDVRIEDIAHALTMQCRFSGHVRKRWSVAQHSLMVSDLCPPGLRLEGLLHDAAEAYVIDLPRPLKNASGFERYREIESDVYHAIAKRFGLAFPMAMAHKAKIKTADDIILWAEAYALLHGTKEWSKDKMPPDIDMDQFNPLVQAIKNASPPTDDYIKEEFLRTFYALGGE